MEKLFDIQTVLFNDFEKEPFYDRDIYQRITYDNRLTGLMGARGVGKTTFLLKQAIELGGRERKALYVSADNIYFLEHQLYDLVDTLYKETDVRVLFIDEVQKYPNWNQELKNIADTFRNFRVLFSGSSMIDLVRSKYDLSRRATLHHLYGLSFREYLAFYHNVQIPKITFDELIENHIAIAESHGVNDILKHFKNYLKTGYYPFFRELALDREKFQAIENAVQKAIYEDIAVLHSLKTPTLMLIEKLYKFVINSSAGEISAFKLASSLEKDFASVTQYLDYLNQAGLICFLYPKKAGHAALKKPSKMYPDNTNLMYSSFLPQTQDSLIGKVRETFFINQVQGADLPIFYHQSGDFIVEDVVVEIGGKSKTKKQLNHQKKAYLVLDGILTGRAGVIPLYLFGLLN